MTSGFLHFVFCSSGNLFAGLIAFLLSVVLLVSGKLWNYVGANKGYQLFYSPTVGTVGKPS